jgi:Domain of unknown function (DUF4062)/Tetratricopeptide repeat
MAKVYVSSTIADLRRERRAVIDWLVAAQHQVVHSYRPSGETVRDGCLEDVDTCDLYVLIAGHRYGFQPPDDNPEGLSITHMEFRRAGQSRIPRIALVRTSIPDVSQSDIDDPQKAPLVRAFRAEVARKVRTAQFHDNSGLIQGLSTGIQAELAKLGRRPGGDRAASDRAGGPVLRLAPRPPLLAGREELLAELDVRLTGGDRPGPRTVVLSGLGGAGKTSVAVEYAHRHLGEVGLAWQFPAEDAAVLAAEFIGLAVQLGAAGEAGGGDPVLAVHSALAAYRGEWLLVFDNALDRASVAALAPPAGDGRVLITSQNPNWPLGQGLEVPVLDTEVASGFLGNRTGDPDGQAAQELAVELGGLPLALEQAAAYIQASGGSLVGYLASFRQRRADLLARGEPTGYGKTVATTWSLAFEQLEQSAPSAVGLLRLLACCAPEAIPLPLLVQHRPGLSEELGAEVAEVLVPLLGDQLAARDAIAALRRYSLITPAGDGSVSVHRLVQAVTMDQMPAELAGKWRDAAAAVIEAAIPDDPTQPETWPDFAALLPHAQAALTDNSDGIARMAAYLGHSGNYPAARDLWQRVLDMKLRVHGPKHPDTLFARASVAYWIGEAGDVATARDQYAALLPISQQILGPEHPHTLTTRHEHAHWTGRAGDVAAARDLFAALLPIRERVLGPEHPHTLVTSHSLAYWTGQAGRPAAARDLFAALLPIRERVLGPEHPHTLTTRHEYSRWTGAAGDAAAARDLFAALVPVSQRVLGPEHPHALSTRHHLARWTGEAGDAAAARDQYAALLPIRERVLGPEHPQTLATRRNLADWTRKADGNHAPSVD